MQTKTILVIRHGKIHNPREIAYNQDKVMKPEDIIHLSEDGKSQIREKAHLIQKEGMIPDILFSSPNIRAQETSKILQEELHNAFEIHLNENLQEIYAPGPYIEGMPHKELSALEGKVYGEYWVKKYRHEQPEDIVKRMLSAFWEAADSIENRHVAALVSHGDPIAWLVGTLAGIDPTPDTFHGQYNPKKGDIFMIEVRQHHDSAGEVVEIEKM